MRFIKSISLIVLVLFYISAGINHFRSPASYLAIIPNYLPWHLFLNNFAGCVEIAFGILLIFKRTRTMAAYGIILMLVAFLPVHIYMITDPDQKMGGLIITPLLAWIRLVILQPLLILWAWWHSKVSNI